MLEVTRAIEWDMAHRLASHQGLCRNPHGHRYRLEVTVARDGADDDGNMVFDLKDLAALMREHVHDVLDHAFMISAHDQVMRSFFEAHQHEGFRVVTVDAEPTAETILHWCRQQLEPHLPADVVLAHLRVCESPVSWADWSPSA